MKVWEVIAILSKLPAGLDVLVVSPEGCECRIDGIAVEGEGTPAAKVMINTSEDS